MHTSAKKRIQISRGAIRLAIVTGVLCLATSSPFATAADYSEVPDVRNRPRAVAEALIRGAGLKLGKIYEMSWRRARDRYAVEVNVGSVILQSPSPFTAKRSAKGRTTIRRRVSQGTAVDLLLSAEADGLLPKDLPPPSKKARGEIWTQRKKDEARRKSFRSKARPAPKETRATKPEPTAIRSAPKIRVTSPGTPWPEWVPPEPMKAKPLVAPQPEPVDELVSDDPTVLEYGDDSVLASGSPWGEVLDGPADSERVPDITGMKLTHAEQLARDAKMQLYILRVPGHPVGHVLKQIPPAGEPVSEGRVIKVYITAGGDYQAYIPSAQRATLRQVEVPTLLDLYPPKANRICKDLGFRMQQKSAKRGLPGRVVDQYPAVGERVPPGSMITVYVAPGSKSNGSVARTPRAADGESSESVALASPSIIGPGSGTTLPKQTSVALGFSWHPITGADAYVVELEEQTDGSTWQLNTRKLSKKSAVTIEFDRMSGPTASIRWRVRAIAAGTEGPASPWVLLTP